MRYSFFARKLGQVSDYSLNALKVLALTATYRGSYDFPAHTTVSEFPLHVARELCQPFVQSDWVLFSANLSRIERKSYLQEHSDTASSILPEQDFHKVHVPIITNPQVGMMWTGPGFGHTELVQMEEGTVWLFNTIDLHSVVNLSDDARYHLICRFRGPFQE